MKEFVAVKVASTDHDSLTTTLTSKSADGWDVVGIVSLPASSEIVAYLSRHVSKSAAVAQPSHPTPISASESSIVSATTASATATPSVPADWYKDPARRFDYRYWDGAKWTEHVSRNGVVSKDPPTP